MTFHEMLIGNRVGLPVLPEHPIPYFLIRFVGLYRERRPKIWHNRRCYCAVQPPSTIRRCPVVAPAEGLAR
jgi:hypothetical protein